MIQQHHDVTRFKQMVLENCRSRIYTISVQAVSQEHYLVSNSTVNFYVVGDEKLAMNAQSIIKKKKR